MSNEHSGWFEAFYEAKAAALILYGRALGLGHSEAEDVLQETFIALMQRDELPREPEHYCLRSFRNRALNYKRSLWRRLTRELESQRWFEKSDGESPAEHAAMQQLAGLPPEQREVIVLKIWNQCTFEEIGALLDLSPNTAAGRYRYGLQKIKSQLEGVSYERDESLETQLHSWRPRRPSARLKRRLFGLSFTPGAAWIIGSLAPAAACLLLTFGVIEAHSGNPYPHGPVMVASNWSNATMVVDAFSDKQNHWSTVTFDSTNGSGFGSTNGSFRQ